MVGSRYGVGTVLPWGDIGMAIGQHREDSEVTAEKGARNMEEGKGLT